MLAIQKYIIQNGLAAAVETFKLVAREYPHKVLLKYNQIESDMKLREVQECRGIILEKGTWNVMCMSFKKFFNSAEGSAATIDWSTAVVMEKLDGSLIQLYFDYIKDEWIVATSGSGEAEGEVNNKLGTTFSQLFWQTAAKYNLDKTLLDTRFTYVFELTTPYNIVVKPHGESTLTLLAMRNVRTLEEMTYKIMGYVSNTIGIPVVKTYNLNAMSPEDLIATFEGMPFTEEGYVVVDSQFNRIKIKNPAYVAVHHTVTGSAYHNIIQIIKDNEVDEFIAYFVERRKEVLHLQANFKELETKLDKLWATLLNFKNIREVTQKEYAFEVFRLLENENLSMFSGLFFALNSGKVLGVRAYLNKLDNKTLYGLLIKDFQK